MRVVSFRSCGWMPLAVSSFMLIGILISYIWAVIRKDVVAFLPFISEAGGSPPQSGFFGIFLFLAAFAGALTLLVRFYSVRQNAGGIRWARIINNISIVLGFISLTGMVVVAAYPINTKKGKEEWVLSTALPHTIGAFSTFIVGVMYAISQAALTFLLRSRSADGRWLSLTVTRVILCICAMTSVLVMISYRPAVQGDNQNSTTIAPETTTTPVHVTTLSDNTWVSSQDKLVNIIAEWVLALMLMFFFVTLYPEMKVVLLTVDLENQGKDSPTASGNGRGGKREYGTVEETPAF